MHHSELRALPGASFWSGADGEEPSQWVVDYERGDGEARPSLAAAQGFPSAWKALSP
jgi:hypothetical protein